MSEIFEQIQNLVSRGEIRISDHGYDQLAADDIGVREVVEGVQKAQVIEEYPDYPKGPCVLVMQRTATRKRFTSYGEFLSDSNRRRYLLRPIDPIPANG